VFSFGSAVQVETKSAFKGRSARAGKPRPGNDILDHAYGLSNCADDENLYQQILSDFIVVHKNDLQQIDERLMQGDFETARMLDHSLKNSSALLGAKNLRDAAFAVETALAE
jgi:HPt (histidine-containing phosphotransfer) domain-containing protein